MQKFDLVVSHRLQGYNKAGTPVWDGSASDSAAHTPNRDSCIISIISIVSICIFGTSVYVYCIVQWKVPCMEPVKEEKESQRCMVDGRVCS